MTAPTILSALTPAGGRLYAALNPMERQPARLGAVAHSREVAALAPYRSARAAREALELLGGRVDP